jgi:hypothetical protein
LRHRFDRADFTNTSGTRVIYFAAQYQMERIYAMSGFLDAIFSRGLPRIIPPLFSLAWLLYNLPHLVISAFPRFAASFITEAIAAPGQASSASFQPPLGLSQNLFDIIVFVFVVAMIGIIATLLYSGFLAKTKNVKAANLVEHFGTFLLGAFFGTRV